MNIIEKLETFQQQLVGDGLVVQAVELQNIIEEYKAIEKKPIGIIVLTSEGEGHEMRMNFYPDAIKQGRVFIGDQLFTHPQLSDETVKDAERLDWLQAQSVGEMGWCARLSGIGRGYRLHQDPSNVNGYNVRQAIDEAMKADNEPS